MTDESGNVGWERDAQDETAAEEAALVAENPALGTPQVMRRSLPVGRFLLLLVAMCIAVPLVVYFIFGR